MGPNDRFTCQKIVFANAGEVCRFEILLIYLESVDASIPAISGGFHESTERRSNETVDSKP